jgi:hypothetical protein
MKKEQAVARQAATKAKGKFADEKFLGPEPDLRDNTSLSKLIQAYTWYNYFYDADASKRFTLEYLTEIAFDKNVIRNLKKVDSKLFGNLGWGMRILRMGGDVPEETLEKIWEKVYDLAEIVIPAPVVVEDAPKVVNIQERIRNRANDLIANIEDALDLFYVSGESFDAAAFMRANDVKGVVATRIADYYRPLYAEVFDASNMKDGDLIEAYAGYTKKKFKEYLVLLKGILSACETRLEVTKKVRKPRAKKEKPARVVVAKVQYKAEDPEYKLKSVSPETILGASQVWLFNTKYRALSVLNAVGPTGLTVKGTTVGGFDEKTSLSKRLRKPETVLPTVLKGGKVALRTVLDSVRAKENPANGRINSETIILKAIK